MADTNKRTAGETLDVLRAMAEEEALDEAGEKIRAMSDDDVARAIAEEGGDPVGIGERGAALAARLLERRARLAWQERAAERLRQATARARSTQRTPRGLPRKELLDRLEVARRDTRLAAPIAAAFRNRSPEESSDEELAALLDEIAILEGIGGDGEVKGS